MKRIVATILGIAFAVSLTATAAQKTPLTDDQKAVRKEMIEKYDADKNGKLDKQEMAKMTPEDKAKYEKAFPPKQPKKTAPAQ
jgi:hypothetical protein